MTSTPSADSLVLQNYGGKITTQQPDGVSTLLNEVYSRFTGSPNAQANEQGVTADKALNSLNMSQLNAEIQDAISTGDVAKLNDIEAIVVHTPLQLMKGQENNIDPSVLTKMVSNLKTIETAKFYAAQNPNSPSYIGNTNGLTSGGQGQVFQKLSDINDYYGDGTYTAADGTTHKGLEAQLKDKTTTQAQLAAAHNSQFGTTPMSNITAQNVLDAYDAGETAKNKLSQSDPGYVQYKLDEKTGNYTSTADPTKSITPQQYAQLETDWTKATGKFALGGGLTADLSKTYFEGDAAAGTGKIWVSATGTDGKPADYVISDGAGAVTDWAALQEVAKASSQTLGGEAKTAKDAVTLPGLVQQSDGSISFTKSTGGAPAVVSAALAANAASSSSTVPMVEIGDSAMFKPLLERAGIQEDANGAITEDSFNQLYASLPPAEKAEWDTKLAGYGIAGDGTKAGSLTAWSKLGSALAAQYTAPTTATTPVSVTDLLYGKGATGTDTTAAGAGTSNTPVSTAAGSSANGLTAAFGSTAAGSTTNTGANTGTTGTTGVSNMTPDDYLKSLAGSPGMGATSAQATTAAARVKAEQALRQYAVSNGVTLSPDALNQQVDGVLAGTTTTDKILDQYRKINASKYPGLSDQLKAGENLSDLATGYISQMAQTLELNTQDINVNDPLIQKGLSSIDETSGKMSQMPLWKFNELLQDDPRYQYTDQAHKSYGDLAASIGKYMKGY